MPRGAKRATALAIHTAYHNNADMLLSKRERPILIVNLISLAVFSYLAVRKSNAEFLLYVGVIIVVLTLIVVKQRSVRFEPAVLWGLTVWAVMHLAGGTLDVGDDTLYSLMLAPLVPRLHILRYDQVVHAFGFGAATLVCHHLLRPYLRDGIERRAALLCLIALMGCGLGAINEIIEFVAVMTVPETGVGGYENTMLDLVFNLLGGTSAVVWLGLRRAGPFPARE